MSGLAFVAAEKISVPNLARSEEAAALKARLVNRYMSGLSHRANLPVLCSSLVTGVPFFGEMADSVQVSSLPNTLLLTEGVLLLVLSGRETFEIVDVVVSCVLVLVVDFASVWNGAVMI